MTYPGSEQVSYTYNGQMMLQGMEGTNIYIQSTTYDAAGRMTERVLGNGMTKAYSYYPWSQQGGRLQNLTTGSMQNMSYTYDEAGNVTTITDTLAGPQTQEFSYNAADMVIQASATGGTYGLYSENYSYSSGNLYNKGGVTNTYGDEDHPHAVTARSNGNTYVYDYNGNQTQRDIGNDTYDLKYDAESRLVEVKKNSTVIATFTYDGDGKQVKSTINGVTTYYVGAYYQKEGTVVTKYYYAGAERVAMRQGGVLYYIFGDHLGSTAVVKNTQGGKTELRYTAWGTTRYEYGTTPTDRRYTGQREEASFGLYFYNARWYDPALGRFIQADTIVPGAGNPQAWDRYAYTSNNPVKYIDPSGHKVCDEVDVYGNCIGWSANFVLSKYGISAQGNNREQQWVIAIAATYSGEKFSQFIPGSSVNAFRKAHGAISIEVVGGIIKDGNCETTGSTIICINSPTLTNILHEFGHVFDNHYSDLTGKLASDNIPMEWNRSEEGYKCPDRPCMEHSDYKFQYLDHPLLEEFGDMYLNWVLDTTNINPAKMGFSTDVMGNARRNWMNSWMETFILRMMLK